MNYKIKALLGGFSIAILSGCSTLTSQQMMNENPKQAEAMIQELNQLAAMAPTQNTERSFVEYRLIPERDDLNRINKRLKHKVEDTQITNGTLSYVLNEFARELDVGLVYNLESSDVMNRKISLSTNKTRVRDYIKIIENTANIDIYFVGNNMVVSDTIAITGSFSKLEGVETGRVYKNLRGYLEIALTRPELIVSKTGQKSTRSKASKDPIKQITGIDENAGLNSLRAEVEEAKRKVVITQLDNLTDKSETEDVAYKPKIVIDESTGAFYIRTEPNLLRSSKKLIEEVINSSLSYALIQLDVYKVNDSKAKRFGVSAEKVVDNLYRMSLGAVPDLSAAATEAGMQLVRQDGASGDVFKLGVEAYQKNGVLRAESNTILTVFNGIESVQNDLKETGYWIPGDLKENTNTIDGVIVTTYTESKPSYEYSEVGKSLKITPRVDLSKKTVNMSVSYSDSDVYAYDEFTWTRNSETGDVVTLRNPLKTKNEINGVVFVKDGDYAVLSGTQSREGSLEREGVPGTGLGVLRDLGGITSENSVKTNNLMVIKPVFPDRKEVSLVKKVKVL